MNIFGVIIVKSKNLFAETFANRNPMGPFIILSEVDSTNNYAMAKLHAGTIKDGTCFQAIEQSHGKGQRGRSWVVSKGENITMSLCVRPPHPQFPFLLSASMVLGCYDFTKDHSVTDVSVKWPNDVYLNDRKAAGVLIENIFHGSTWTWAVVGIGLNLNQSDWGGSLPNATSLKRVTGAVYDVTAMGKLLHRYLIRRIQWMKTATASEIMEQFNTVLYKKNQEVKLKMGAAVFSTVIRSVTHTGELITQDTMIRSFTVGEVVFL